MHHVTRPARVWIETYRKVCVNLWVCVTRPARVWIETMATCQPTQRRKCHPPRAGVD